MLKKKYTALGLVTVTAVAAVIAAAAGCSGGGESDDDKKIVEYLFVQNASAVSLKDGDLRLKGVAAETLYFSDRPDRIVGRVTTKEYVDHWAVGGNSFADDPPNAVLSIHHEPEPQDIVVMLRKPRLDGADLVYEVDVLDGKKTAAGGASALFIDTIGRPATPLRVGGVHRVHRLKRQRIQRAVRR